MTKSALIKNLLPIIVYLHFRKSSNCFLFENPCSYVGFNPKGLSALVDFVWILACRYDIEALFDTQERQVNEF